MSLGTNLLEEAAAMVEGVLPGVAQIRSSRTRSRRGRGAGEGAERGPGFSGRGTAP